MHVVLPYETSPELSTSSTCLLSTTKLTAEPSGIRPAREHDEPGANSTPARNVHRELGDAPGLQDLQRNQQRIDSGQDYVVVVVKAAKRTQRNPCSGGNREILV